jgi:hypothetical protein
MSTLETIKHQRKKLKKILEYGNISHVQGLPELILWKWPYYKKWSTDSLQFPSKFKWHYHRSRKTTLQFMQRHNGHAQTKQ